MFGGFSANNNNNNSVFGSNNSGGFGSSTFGNNNNKTNSFGSPSGGFGTTTTNTGFGSPSTGFGSTSSFGGNNQTSGTSLFGSTTPSTTNTGFGGFGTTTTQSTSSFGGFGSNTTGSFGSQPQNNIASGGSSNVNYGPTQMGGDGKDSAFKMVAISAMAQFQGANEKTLEEIRILDYQSKLGQSGSGFGNSTVSNTNSPFGGTANTGGMFGNTQSQSSGGLFGSNTTNTATSGGLFGNNANTSSGGGLFGNNNNNSNSSGFSFGNNNTTTAAFGGTNTFGQNNTTPSGSLFGNNNATQSTGFGTTTANNNASGGLFGSNTNNSGGLFGNNNNNNKPAAFGNTNSGGLFGNTNNNATNTGFGSNTNTGGSLFGNTPNTNAFGSNNATSSGGLFGNSTNTSTGGGLFGSNNNNNSGGGLFGSNTNTSGGLFGNTNNNTSSGGLFGSSTSKPTGGSLFGNNNTSSGGGLFGNSNTNNNSGGLFGNSSGGGGGLFGSNNNNSNSTSLFGNTSSNSGGGLFGNNSNNNNNSGSLFGNNNNAANSNPNDQMLMQLVNLSSYGSSSSLEMKKHLELAKRAWDPLNDDQYMNHYGPKKFKFHISLPNDSDRSAVDESRTMKKKLDSLLPQTPQKRAIASVGALVVRSSEKSRTPLKIKKANDLSVTKKLKLLSSAKLFNLQDKFKINKSNRSIIPQLADKQSTIPTNSIDSLEEKSVEPDEQNFVYSFGKGRLSKSVKPTQVDLVPSMTAEMIQLGYTTVPSMSQLAGMEENELKNIIDFEVLRVGYGSIKFLGPTNLVGMRLSCDLIEIAKDHVEVYKTEEDTPPVGTELNKPSEITLTNVGTPVGFHGSFEAYKDFLATVYTAKIGGTFISYEITNQEKRVGSWKFRVDHFTKYGLAEVSEALSQHSEKERSSTKKKVMVCDRQKFFCHFSPCGSSVSHGLSVQKGYNDYFFQTAESVQFGLEALAIAKAFEVKKERNGKEFKDVVKLISDYRALARRSLQEKPNNPKISSWEAAFDLIFVLYGETYLLLDTNDSKSFYEVCEIVQRVAQNESCGLLVNWTRRHEKAIDISNSVNEIKEALHNAKNLNQIVDGLRGKKANIFVVLLNLVNENITYPLDSFNELYPETHLSDQLLFHLVFCFTELDAFGTSLSTLPDVVFRLSSDLTLTTTNTTNEDEVLELLYANLFLISFATDVSRQIIMEQLHQLLFRCLYRLSRYNILSKDVLENIKVAVANVFPQEDSSFGTNLIGLVMAVLKGRTGIYITQPVTCFEKKVAALIASRDIDAFGTIIEKSMCTAIFNDNVQMQKTSLKALTSFYEEGLDFTKLQDSSKKIDFLELYCQLTFAVSSFLSRAEEEEGESEFKNLVQISYLFNQFVLKIGTIDTEQSFFGDHKKLIQKMKESMAAKYEEVKFLLEALKGAGDVETFKRNAQNNLETNYCSLIL